MRSSYSDGPVFVSLSGVWFYSVRRSVVFSVAPDKFQTNTTNMATTDFLRILLDICLGAFAKLRKVALTFVMSVRLFVRNDSTLTGRFLIKLEI